MKFGRVRFGPLHLLFILIVLLAGSLAAMWFDKHGEMRNVTWQAPHALQPDIKVQTHAQQATPVTPTLYAAILERPIFAPDRRPVPPVTVTPPDPLANIQIMGIFSGTNAGILARIDSKVRRVKVNESVGSWTLKSIDSRNVTFAQGEENRQLQLAYARLDTPAQQAAGNATKTPGSPGLNTAPPQLNPKDEARERLRIRNAARAARGFPPIVE